MLDPDIAARVAALEAEGVYRGDAIGQAAYERDHAGCCRWTVEVDRAHDAYMHPEETQ